MCAYANAKLVYKDSPNNWFYHLGGILLHCVGKKMRATNIKTVDRDIKTTCVDT